MFIIIIILYSLIAGIDVVPLYKNKQKKELSIYFASIAICCFISILTSLDIKIVSPSMMLQEIVISIKRLF
ncbi:hypothetical protein ACFIJ5_04665 [Haloimpatiens sp. FM7330]|uniref:hypothetical protein n=1 Tax=Haloimpatiens sp. FM7330 TaxID=3298610 RepID=UPI0036402260